jgi:hypothetical protein
MRVCVIGCGPAGLFAAEACRVLGAEYRILSPKPEPSIITGAQYLHRPIPSLTSPDPDGMIRFEKMGSRDGYAMKVYGNMAMPVSWDTFDEGVYPYWSLREVYARAWTLHDAVIFDQAVQPEDIAGLQTQYDLIINTAPLKALCLQGHDFTSQSVFITAPQELYGKRENKIVYNGLRAVGWYRWSLINGISCYEFPKSPNSQQIKTHEIKKPLANFCDCHPRMLRVGRYGEWKKGKLTHHAYEEAYNAVQQMQ